MAFIEKKDFLKILIIFIFTRILVLMIGFMAFGIFPQNGHVYQRGVAKEVVKNPEPVWDQFDSKWYIKLAKDGYPQREFTDDRMETWGFMPLYSLCVKGIAKVFGGNYFWAGVVFSNICSFLALLIVFKLLKEKFGQGVNTIAYILICAGSFYLSIVYADSLFLLITSLVFYFTHKQKYAWALIFAGLATVTRIQGCLLYLIPGIEILIQKRAYFYKYIPVTLLSFLPLGIFMMYLNKTCGDPLAFLNIQNAWGSHSLYPLQGFVGLFHGYRPVGSFTNALFWVLTLGIVLSKYKQLPLSYVIFTVFYFLLSTSNEAIYGTTRYILAVIPLYVALGMSSKKVQDGFNWLNVAFLALTIAAFVTNTGSFI